MKFFALLILLEVIGVGDNDLSGVIDLCLFCRIGKFCCCCDGGGDFEDTEL